MVKKTGMSKNRKYPGLTREDILACLAYAGLRLKAERVYPLTIAGD